MALMDEAEEELQGEGMCCVTPEQWELGGAPDGAGERAHVWALLGAGQGRGWAGMVRRFALRGEADAAAADRMRTHCSLCNLSESIIACAFESCFPCPESTLLARLASWCLCLSLARGAPAFDSFPSQTPIGHPSPST